MSLAAPTPEALQREAPAPTPLPEETVEALEALEDARQELATEEGLVVIDEKAPEESFRLNHERVIRRIDDALEPFAGQYRAPDGEGE